MAASSRRARRGGPRAPPKPEDPPRGLLRQGNIFASLAYGAIEALLGNEANKQRKSQSYSKTLKSSDATARSIDNLSKTEIETKLTNCVKTFWETYDEAMEKFEAQNVEAPAPAPAAVAPEPEDLDALVYADLTNLVTARMARKWAATQNKKYENLKTVPGMRELLRDQAADPTQWDLVRKHQAPAPKYVETGVAYSTVRGAQDGDTWAKWMSALTTEPPTKTFESLQKEARIAISRTLPTLKHSTAGGLREALAERLGRPATPNDVKEVFRDAADDLKGAWDEYEMIPDGYEGVTVEDLWRRLEATEARAMRRSNAADRGELSEERTKELGCNDMYYACAATSRDWSRDLALALGDRVEDYAKKAAQFKHDHHGNIGCIRDVRAAVLESIRQRRRGLLFTERSRSEIRNHTLPMRRARKTVHRAAVTSSHLMTWGY